ncbi:hypothetical protein PsorP6_008520 [Peronosclerospora sorghi]|uniref:Uncharacterized protein n=1 Tax=Peronosclerospora sorghi TaxID=230839 RepID=A0ACC0W9T3_9STRA|nr:hypothetical protein PsorP6_008520 [Peronosclerospora sorghi]
MPECGSLPRDTSVNERALGAWVCVVLRSRAATIVIQLAHDSTDEDAPEKVGHDMQIRLLHLCQVQMHILVLRSQRGHTIVLQTTQLQLVGKWCFNVS